MGRDYPVQAEAGLLSDKDASGVLYRRECRIGIDPNDAPVSQAETILHEIMKSLKGDLSLKIEHADLLCFSEGLFAVLRDNPKVAEHIVKGQRVVPRQKVVK